MKLRHIAALGAVGLLFGCASIVEGTDQTLNVKISPDSASCEITQKGKLLGTLSNGGGQITVPKSRKDLTVECTAPGYRKQIVSLESSASGWGIVGCFLIDLCITDYSTGALNKYDEVVNITLPRDTGVATSGFSAGSTPAGFRASPAPPVLTANWRTTHDKVRGYWGQDSSRQFIEMPSSVPLKLVHTQGQWGLFEYTGKESQTGQVWILRSETRAATQ